jgi:GDPmannose 4,6-dehydratase
MALGCDLSMRKTALIFGVSGQDGAYLGNMLLEKGYVVLGTSRDCEQTRFDNLRQVGAFGRVTLWSASPTDFRSVLQVIKDAEADEIYNLAGQSSVALSFDQPVETIDSSVKGTLKVF